MLICLTRCRPKLVWHWRRDITGFNKSLNFLSPGGRRLLTAYVRNCIAVLSTTTLLNRKAYEGQRTITCWTKAGARHGVVLAISPQSSSLGVASPRSSKGASGRRALLIAHRFAASRALAHEASYRMWPWWPLSYAVTVESNAQPQSAWGLPSH